MYIQPRDISSLAALTICNCSFKKKKKAEKSLRIVQVSLRHMSQKNFARGGLVAAFLIKPSGFHLRPLFLFMSKLVFLVCWPQTAKK